MSKKFVYRNLVQDADGEVIYEKQWTYRSALKAVEHLKEDYFRDYKLFKTTEAFYSHIRAWRSTEDGWHMQYDVFNVEK